MDFKELGKVILVQLVKRFFTPDNIKKVRAELITKLIELLKKDGTTELEAIIIEVLEEIRA
jgi:hypothetical protein